MAQPIPISVMSPAAKAVPATRNDLTSRDQQDCANGPTPALATVPCNGVPANQVDRRGPLVISPSAAAQARCDACQQQRPSSESLSASEQQQQPAPGLVSGLLDQSQPPAGAHLSAPASPLPAVPPHLAPVIAICVTTALGVACAGNEGGVDPNLLQTAIVAATAAIADVNRRMPGSFLSPFQQGNRSSSSRRVLHEGAVHPQDLHEPPAAAATGAAGQPAAAGTTAAAALAAPAAPTPAAQQTAAAAQPAGGSAVSAGAAAGVGAAAVAAHQDSEQGSGLAADHLAPQDPTAACSEQQADDNQQQQRDDGDTADNQQQQQDEDSSGGDVQPQQQQQQQQPPGAPAHQPPPATAEAAGTNAQATAATRSTTTPAPTPATAAAATPRPALAAAAAAAASAGQGNRLARKGTGGRIMVRPPNTGTRWPAAAAAAAARSRAAAGAAAAVAASPPPSTSPLLTAAAPPSPTAAAAAAAVAAAVAAGATAGPSRQPPAASGGVPPPCSPGPSNLSNRSGLSARKSTGGIRATSDAAQELRRTQWQARGAGEGLPGTPLSVRQPTPLASTLKGGSMTPQSILKGLGGQGTPRSNLRVSFSLQDQENVEPGADEPLRQQQQQQQGGRGRSRRTQQQQQRPGQRRGQQQSQQAQPQQPSAAPSAGQAAAAAAGSRRDTGAAPESQDIGTTLGAEAAGRTAGAAEPISSPAAGPQASPAPTPPPPAAAAAATAPGSASSSGAGARARSSSLPQDLMVQLLLQASPGPSSQPAAGAAAGGGSSGGGSSGGGSSSGGGGGTAGGNSSGGAAAAPPGGAGEEAAAEGAAAGSSRRRRSARSRAPAAPEAAAAAAAAAAASGSSRPNRKRKAAAAAAGEDDDVPQQQPQQQQAEGAGASGGGGPAAKRRRVSSKRSQAAAGAAAAGAAGGEVPVEGAEGEGGSGSGSSKKRRRSSTGVAVPVTQEDWEQLAAAAGVAPVVLCRDAATGESIPLWQATADDLQLVEGDVLEHLEKTAVQYEAGREPWRGFAGVEVREQANWEDVEMLQPVIRCRAEFWRLHRLAQLDESKRVAGVKEQRAAALQQHLADGGIEASFKFKEPSTRPDRVAESRAIKEGKALFRDDKGLPLPQLGSLPGVNVNDSFWLRSEMLVAGLHPSPVGGITTAPLDRASGGLLRGVRVAVSVVVSGNYQDDHDGPEQLVYTGAGGNDLLGNRKQVEDQKLDGSRCLLGNVALGVPVRLVRKNKEPKSPTGAHFVYDGLWDVVSYSKAKGKEGFLVYKFLLRRRRGQPEPVTSPVEWGGVKCAPMKVNVLTRPHLVCHDLSKGLEGQPVVVVNEVDRELPPGLDPVKDAYWLVSDDGRPLEASSSKLCYVTDYVFDEDVGPPDLGEVPHGCDSQEAHELLQRHNYGRLPYSLVNYTAGCLSVPVVADAGVVYECGPAWGCTDAKCVQRQAQLGLQRRLEVFKTHDGRGWGVRSWDFIPAASVVVVFVGRVISQATHEALEDTEYTFEVGPRPDYDDQGRPLPEGQTRHVNREFTIDAREVGNVARFINHSCMPNLYVQPMCLGHNDTNRAAIVLVASRHIRPWEELTYDYGAGHIQSHFPGGCRCGTAGCCSPWQPPAAAAAGSGGGGASSTAAAAGGAGDQRGGGASRPAVAGGAAGAAGGGGGVGQEQQQQQQKKAEEGAGVPSRRGKRNGGGGGGAGKKTNTAASKNGGGGPTQT